jgi:hypothetical protein
MCGDGPEKIGPTATQTIQTDINQSLWEYYLTDYKPLVTAYVQKSTSPETTALQEKKMSGQVNADIMKGAKPVSSNPVNNQKAMMNIADAGTIGKTNATMGAKAHKIGSEMNVIDIGRGQTTKAMAGLDELASMSSETAIRDKARDLETQAAMENAAGTSIGALAGTGLSAFKSYDNKKFLKTLKE